MLIFVLLLMPTDGLEDHTPDFWDGFDKIIHGILFGVWSFLMCRASIEKWNRIHYFPILCALIFVALLTEYLQSLTSYRSFETADILADVIGGIIVLMGFKYFDGKKFS